MWNCTHFRHPTDEQLRHVDIYFLATNIICSLSTLNCKRKKFALTREVKNSERLPSWENNMDCDRFKCRLERTNEIRSLERCWSTGSQTYR